MSNKDCGNAVVMITGIVITGVGFGFLFNILKNNAWCYRRCLERRGKDSLDRNGEDNNVDYQFGWSEKIIDRKHYAERIKQLRHLLDEAYQQMQQGQFRYAIYDANIVMRETVKMMVQYENGDDILDDLLLNMKICEREKLFGSNKDFINRLYEIYHICECDGREFKIEEHLNHRKVYFVIMQLKDLLNFVENRMISI